MTDLLPLCFFALLGAILTKICDELFPRFKPYLLCGIGVVFFLLFAKWVFPLVEKISSLGNKTQVPELFRLLYKGLSLALLVSVSASFCRDLGEEKIAAKLEVCGKGAILYLSLPVLEQILNWIGEMVV